MTLEPKVNGNDFPRRFHDRPSGIPRTHFLELRCKHYPTNVQLVVFKLGWLKALDNFKIKIVSMWDLFVNVVSRRHLKFFVTPLKNETWRFLFTNIRRRRRRRHYHEEQPRGLITTSLKKQRMKLVIVMNSFWKFASHICRQECLVLFFERSFYVYFRPLSVSPTSIKYWFT